MAKPLVPEKRRLTTYTIGLTAEQVSLKDRMMREAEAEHPEVSEYFRELCVDFCVRNPEEATRVRETGEWEVESKHSPAALANIFCAHNKQQCLES